MFTGCIIIRGDLKICAERHYGVNLLLKILIDFFLILKENDKEGNLKVLMADPVRKVHSLVARTSFCSND